MHSWSGGLLDIFRAVGVNLERKSLNWLVVHSGHEGPVGWKVCSTFVLVSHGLDCKTRQTDRESEILLCFSSLLRRRFVDHLRQMFLQTSAIALLHCCTALLPLQHSLMGFSHAVCDAYNDRLFLQTNVFVSYERCIVVQLFFVLQHGSQDTA